VTIVNFIQDHGYWALFVGAFLEGEFVLLAAGFLAHRGYMELPWALGVALAGTFSADQFFFMMGRLTTGWLRRSRPALFARAKLTGQRIRRHQWKVIFGFRFLYGTRVVVPFLIGAARYPVSRYLAIDAIAACSWTLLVGALGYLLGEALASLLPTLHRYELVVLLVVLGVAFLCKALFWRHRRKHPHHEPEMPDQLPAPPEQAAAPDSGPAGPRSQEVVR
jgi:membrane protein DedA with SNARE-associated domain